MAKTPTDQAQMVNHRKFIEHLWNQIPVYVVPGEFYVNLCEPESTENFSIGAAPETFNNACLKIEGILTRCGGVISTRLPQYSRIYISNADDGAVTEICELACVSRVGPEVSMIPTKGRRIDVGA